MERDQRINGTMWAQPANRWADDAALVNLGDRLDAKSRPMPLPIGKVFALRCPWKPPDIPFLSSDRLLTISLRASNPSVIGQILEHWRAGFVSLLRFHTPDAVAGTSSRGVSRFLCRDNFAKSFRITTGRHLNST